MANVNNITKIIKFKEDNSKKQLQNLYTKSRYFNRINCNVLYVLVIVNKI